MDLSQQIDEVTTLVPWQIDVLIENETAINLTPPGSSVNCPSSLSYLSSCKCLTSFWKGMPKLETAPTMGGDSRQCGKHRMYIGRGKYN